MSAHSVRCLAPAATLLVAFLAATPAAAIGYWNVPGSFYQCMGCGWGAGHHAPLVLGPVSCRGWCTTNEIRLPYPPSPPCTAYGHGWHGYDLTEPSWLGPAGSPEVLPAPASARPLFGPPVEP